MYLDKSLIVIEAQITAQLVSHSVSLFFTESVFGGPGEST